MLNQPWPCPRILADGLLVIKNRAGWSNGHRDVPYKHFLPSSNQYDARVGEIVPTMAGLQQTPESLEVTSSIV